MPKNETVTVSVSESFAEDDQQNSAFEVIPPRLPVAATIESPEAKKQMGSPPKVDVNYIESTAVAGAVDSTK